MARLGFASAWTTWMVLTVGAGCSGPAEEPAAPPGAGGGGVGGAGASTATTTGGSAVATAVSVGASGAGGGGSAFVCDPPAAPGSLYELSALSYDLREVDPVSMCRIRGDVALLVNIAAV
jgi:hypothetical protein